MYRYIYIDILLEGWRGWPLSNQRLSTKTKGKTGHQLRSIDQTGTLNPAELVSNAGSFVPSRPHWLCLAWTLVWVCPDR